MTEHEKKMKRYVNAVERRLNMPRHVKARVMSDFTSSILSRREGGMEDEAIYAEFGSPRQAAADLNEQMKEYTFRKSPWRFLFLPVALYGAVELLTGLAVRLWFLLQLDPMLQQTGAASMGIIGGADGPTAIFLTTPGWMHYINPALFLLIGVSGYVAFSRRRPKKNH